MVRMTALNFVSAGILQCPEGAVKEIWRANRLWTIDVCCNSTLFNARPKTSWKSCQSSWRNWRSRPSTRQVGRLQIVNSKLTIGQKSLDNMNIVHNNVIVYATYFHLCQYWYSHYGFRFSRTEHMISFVSLVMVITNDDADAVVVDDDDDDDDSSYHLKHTMVTTSVHRCLLVRGIFWAHSCFLRWVSIASQKTTNIQNVTIFVETILILLLLPPLPTPMLYAIWSFESMGVSGLTPSN